MNSIINAQQPRTDFDFADIIRKNMPTVSHEIGQWCVYPNFKEIEKYTGVLKAKNFEIFQETLKEHHMADLADDFLFASGRLQTLCYKADIEGALRTPGFAGFQLLDLHDFPGQGTALVGVLDPFWEEKGYVTPEEYSTFCNKTVPLVRFPKGLAEQRDIERSPRSGTFRRKTVTSSQYHLGDQQPGRRKDCTGQLRERPARNQLHSCRKYRISILRHRKTDTIGCQCGSERNRQ